MSTGQFEVPDGAYEKVLRCGWRNVGVLAACALPVAVGILVVEYRLMLFSIILVAVPLIAFLDTWTVHRAARGFRASSVAWNEVGVTLRGTEEMRILPFQERRESPRPSGTLIAPVGVDPSQPGLALVRVRPDAILLIEALPSRKWRSVAVPASGATAGALADYARSRGVPVQMEKPVSLALAALLAGALLSIGAGKVAAVLVIGGLANTILYFAGRSGSLPLAGALFAGALVLLVVKALLRLSLERPPAH